MSHFWKRNAFISSFKSAYFEYGNFWHLRKWRFLTIWKMTIWVKSENISEVKVYDSLSMSHKLLPLKTPDLCLSLTKIGIFRITVKRHFGLKLPFSKITNFELVIQVFCSFQKHWISELSKIADFQNNLSKLGDFQKVEKRFFSKRLIWKSLKIIWHS